MTVDFVRSTVAATVEIEGVGLHSGEPVRVRILPSESGIEFRLGTETVRATPENVTDTKRCTRLGPIAMVEHLMSALSALEITDAIVEVSAPELPGLDGSAARYYDAVAAAGKVSVGTATVSKLFSRLFLQEDAVKVAVGSGTGHWRYLYDVSPRWPGVQAFETPDVIAAYREEIAPARTVVLSEEIEYAIQNGMGKGLDATSVLIVGKEGYDNPPARFENEIARHKLLDLMGDLYLSGVPARLLNVVSERGGHRSNVLCAANLLAAARRE